MTRYALRKFHNSTDHFNDLDISLGPINEGSPYGAFIVLDNWVPLIGLSGGMAARGFDCPGHLFPLWFESCLGNSGHIEMEDED